jgi:excisionase family DNA binding protein
MVTLPTLIPISEAARKYGLDEAHLRTLVEKGKIRAAMVGGEVVVSEDEVKKRAEKENGNGEKKENLLEYQKNAHLQGVGIGIAEAARKYNLAFSTVQNWVKVGYVKKIRQEGQKILVDEADVAYCNEVYRSRGGTRGRWLFKPDGTPYEPKKRAMIQRQ